MYRVRLSALNFQRTKAPCPTSSHADAGIGHVDCSVVGGIPLHSLQEGESGMAAVAILRERCDDNAQRYSGVTNSSDT